MFFKTWSMKWLVSQTIKNTCIELTLSMCKVAWCSRHLWCLRNHGNTVLFCSSGRCIRERMLFYTNALGSETRDSVEILRQLFHLSIFVLLFLFWDHYRVPYCFQKLYRCVRNLFPSSSIISSVTIAECGSWEIVTDTTCYDLNVFLRFHVLWA